MDIDVRVLVMERGGGLTHDFTLACRHSGVSVLGPVRDVVEAQAAAAEIRVDVIAVELTGRSTEVIRDVTVTLGGARVLAVTDESDRISGHRSSPQAPAG